MQQLGDEVRANQRATDAVDEVICELLGVNRSEARALDLLEQAGRLTAGQLALQSGLSTGAITGLIDRLERSGLARRVQDSADRRRVLVEMTEKAKQLSWELMGEPMTRYASETLNHYNERELELLLDFTRRGREIQERHAEWLRDRLAAATDRGRPRPASRTAP